MQPANYVLVYDSYDTAQTAVVPAAVDGMRLPQRGTRQDSTARPWRLLAICAIFAILLAQNLSITANQQPDLHLAHIRVVRPQCSSRAETVGGGG
jgi:hypothetical protein